MFGLRYLKIVKSPTGPHFIIDIMFTGGLRLTTNIIPGQMAKIIGEDLDSKIKDHRFSEYHILKPTVDLVAECSERVLADKDGIITECQLHADSIRNAWEMTLFRRYLKTIDPKRITEYETALKALDDVYELDAGPAGN